MYFYETLLYLRNWQIKKVGNSAVQSNIVNITNYDQSSFKYNFLTILNISMLLIAQNLLLLCKSVKHLFLRNVKTLNATFTSFVIIVDLHTV